MQPASTLGYEKLNQLDERTALASGDDQPPDYRSSDEGLSVISVALPESHKMIDLDGERIDVVAHAAKSPFAAAFTRPVVLNIVGYGILA